MEKKINVENIKIAEIREFDTKHNGVAVDFYSYLILIEKDGVYFNPFSEEDNYAVYRRLPYANSTFSGEEYGNKIELIQGEEKDGPCIVLTNIQLPSIKELSLRQLENMIINSTKYYKDRENIVKDRFISHPVKRNKYIKKDRENKEKLERLLNKYNQDTKLLRK